MLFIYIFERERVRVSEWVSERVCVSVCLYICVFFYVSVSVGSLPIASRRVRAHTHIKFAMILSSLQMTCLSHW